MNGNGFFSLRVYVCLIVHCRFLNYYSACFSLLNFWIPFKFCIKLVSKRYWSDNFICNPFGFFVFVLIEFYGYERHDIYAWWEYCNLVLDQRLFCYQVVHLNYFSAIVLEVFTVFTKHHSHSSDPPSVHWRQLVALIDCTVKCVL